MDHTYLEIDLERLGGNLREIGRRVGPGVGIIAVVKANAYGHGALPVSRKALASGASMLAVSSLSEGIELREGGIEAPVLILGPLMPEELDEVIARNLTPILYSAAMRRELERRAGAMDEVPSVHLKVDTGMGRLGILPHDFLTFYEDTLRSDRIKVQGILTHFPCAEDLDFTRGQIELFRRMLDRIALLGASVPQAHCANSAGAILHPEARFDMVRPGFMLYAMPDLPRGTPPWNIQPLMSWKSRIAQIRWIPRGHNVGYGLTFTTQRESLIAVLPVGYAHGYPRAMADGGQVLIRGKRAPVMGSVCMDLTAVDVTDIPEVEEGDEAVLMGEQGGIEITVHDLARLTGTIPYEVFCRIGAALPRVYKGCHGKG